MLHRIGENFRQGSDLGAYFCFNASKSGISFTSPPVADRSFISAKSTSSSDAASHRRELQARVRSRGILLFQCIQIWHILHLSARSGPFLHKCEVHLFERCCIASERTSGKGRTKLLKKWNGRPIQPPRDDRSKIELCSPIFTFWQAVLRLPWHPLRS